VTPIRDDAASRSRASAPMHQGDDGGSWVAEIVAGMLRGPTEADLQAAVARVAELRAGAGVRPTDELVRQVIARTARRTAAIGAASAGAALVPGVGTLAAMTLGTATDVGATLRLQARMVLDIAVLRGAALTPEQARNAVLLVAGVSSASTFALKRAGRGAALRLGERVTARWLLRAVPVVGMLSSSGTNALATHVIGKRADAYFSLGPDALRDWRASVRAVAGIDERRWWLRLSQPFRDRHAASKRDALGVGASDDAD
jgi:hypothetical protein